MRALLSLLLAAVLLTACTSDPALDLEGLESRARTGDQAAIVKLVALLASAENDLGDRVYPVLVALGREAVPALLAKVESADRQQREYVIAALGTLKVAEAVPAIGRVLDSRQLERRYVAAWALGEIAAAEGVPALLKALDDDNSEVRRYATRALIKMNRQAVAPLVAYLPTATERGAAGAVRALGDIADPAAVDVLLTQVGGANRGDAFLALGKLRDPRAEQALIAGLTDADWRVRMNAAMSLGPLGGPEAVAPLRTTLEDEVHVVREWSSRSLEMITGQPVLYRNDKGDYVRSYNVYH